MAKFSVQVSFVTVRDLKVHAHDEQAAEEKAVEIVEGWQNVVSAEATDIEREFD